MRFGVLFDFRNPDRWARPFPRLYEETLDQIAAAEALGFDSVWVTEHHFVPDGYCPSMLPICAAIASRTKRVRIGTAILVLPLHHPIRVAEDAAVVDILSGGRLILGVGLGYRLDEFDGMGIPKKERRLRYEECLEILREAWTQGEFSFRGKHFQIDKARVTPKPVQKPHPPIWLGARNLPALDRAARLGYTPMLAEGVLADQWGMYQSALQQYGRPLGDVATLRFFYTHEDAQQAWDDVKHHLLYIHNDYRRWYGAAQDTAYDQTYRPVESADALPRERFIVGDPPACIEQLKRFLGGVPITHLILRMHFPGLDPAKARKSMELFQSAVAPALGGR